jgi:polyisoprenoid-binding protein YceI
LAKGIEAQTPADVPVIQITKEGSSVRFAVKASVSIEGTFDKWDATITYPSRDVEACVLDIKIQADSVNTGSGMNDDKLKSKDFFNAKDDPYITFHSTKMTQTGPTTVEVQGNFTIRGVSKRRRCSSRLQAKGQASARSKAPWPSTARSLG